MLTNKVKEEDENRIMLVDSVAERVLLGSVVIFFTWHFSHIFFFDYSIHNSRLLVVLFGGGGSLLGLYVLLVKETVIIDKRLQKAVIIKETPIKQFKSVKKIPFSDLKIIEITYNTQFKNCDYNSPVDCSNELWEISLITIGDGSEKIYQGNSKPEVEKVAESISKISSKMITHRTEYTPTP
jgi:hypothetical protein